MSRESDPWADISLPSDDGGFSVRRVDPELAWDFFWGRSNNGKCLLYLRTKKQHVRSAGIPKLKGLTVRVVEGLESQPGLCWQLEDAKSRDIFYQLCCDVIEATRSAGGEGEVVARALTRTLRWHYLLRGGRNTKLTDERQKGLLAELLVLERHFFSELSASDAVRAWRGPYQEAHDFEVERIAVEVKASRGEPSDAVYISSEYQLDHDASTTLYLYVLSLAPARPEDEGGFTLAEVVDRLCEAISDADPAAEVEFRSGVAAAGYRFEDDYSENIWAERQTMVYAVTDEFPAVTCSGIPAPVSNVHYKLDLKRCSDFALSPRDMRVRSEKSNADHHRRIL